MGPFPHRTVTLLRLTVQIQCSLWHNPLSDQLTAHSNDGTLQQRFKKDQLLCWKTTDWCQDILYDFNGLCIDKLFFCME